MQNGLSLTGNYYLAKKMMGSTPTEHKTAVLSKLKWNDSKVLEPVIHIKLLSSDFQFM